MKTHFIRKGYGFDVGRNFARAGVDIPITLAPNEHALKGYAIGYIAEDSASNLGFLKYGSNGLVRCHVLQSSLGDTEQAA